MDIRTIRFKAESLKDNFPQDPDEREVTFIEKDVNDRTPVLIGLSGFFGTSTSFLNRLYGHRDFLSALENIAGRKDVSSFIIVLPDTMTSYFGNQYVDSIAVGSYEQFITRDVKKLIEETYGKRRTGLFGKSSGGFGAYNLTVRNPELFDGFVDVAGDAGFEYCYMKDFPQAVTMISKYGLEGFIAHFSEKPNPTNDEKAAMDVIAMSAFYSPDEASKLKFRLPFDNESFAPDPEVWRTWLKLDPLRNIASNIDILREKKIILQVGSKDEFSINVGMKGMSNILEKNGISHQYKEYDEGHFGIEYLYEDSLPDLLKHLSG